MKMKKLIAMLLACVMLCTLAVPALGETMYEFLKQYLSDPSKNELCFGTPITSSYDKDNKVTLYYMGDGTLCLSGTNSKRQGEACFWFGADEISVLSTFMALCSLWDQFASLCDYGYTPLLAYDFGDGDPLMIDSAYEAQLFVNAVNSVINK